MGDTLDDARTESLPDALDIPKVEDLPAPHFRTDANGKRFLDWRDGHNIALLPLMQRMRARYGSERKMLEAVAAQWGMAVVGGLQNAYYTWKKTGNPSGRWPSSDNGARHPSTRKAPKPTDIPAPTDAVVAPYGPDGSVLIMVTVGGVRQTFIGYPAEVTVKRGPRP